MKRPARRNGSTAPTAPEHSYDAFKEFEGRRYTGMKIGRSHKWRYDPGEWKETKLTPDEWQIRYDVKKRRAGKAPEGSGVPAGTSYHWLILAHQNVTKENANDYSTSMTGVKFKLAHRRAATGKWSAGENAQRRRLIAFLEEVIRDLEQQAPARRRPQTGKPRKPARRTKGRAADSGRRAA